MVIFVFCLFFVNTHMTPSICMTKYTKPRYTWQRWSATNADTKFCAPMPSKSLASRKRPPRSSWTRSIWRVISTAWVTPRYRTPVVVHVVTIVSRRANAIANLRATYKRREDARRMSIGCQSSDILRTSFGRPYNLVLTSSTIYSPTLKYQ